MRAGSCFVALLIAGFVVAAEPRTNLGPVVFATERTEAATPPWRWTPAATHHNAVVKVQAPDGGGGTGVMITHDGEGAIVLTNHHIVGGFTRCKITSTLNGNVFDAVVWKSFAQQDLAIVYAANANPKVTLPICGVLPKVGRQIEIAGYGGPSGKLRSFSGRVLGSNNQRIEVDAHLISGDSGSPMIVDGSTVVAIARGGRTWTLNQTEWPSTYPATADHGGKTFADLVCGVCEPRGYQPQLLLYPPARTIPKPDPHPQLNAPIQNKPDLARKCCVDGKDGADGKPGPAGPPGAAGKDAPSLDVIVAAVLAKMPPQQAATIDPAELAKQIQPHLSPIYPMWVDGDGNVIDELPDGVKLGQTMPLRITAQVIDAGRQ